MRPKPRGFNTQPPEGGWEDKDAVIYPPYWFQHTAARRRLGIFIKLVLVQILFQHTAARRRLVKEILNDLNTHNVSTHSRPKAAGLSDRARSTMAWFQHTAARRRLEKRWLNRKKSKAFQHTAARRRLGRLAPRRYCCSTRFNTQPPEGGWKKILISRDGQNVSTHSRPKAAGTGHAIPLLMCHGFNTQPPEGGWGVGSDGLMACVVSTHSRPKAAGIAKQQAEGKGRDVSTHSRPKAAG